MTPTTLAPSRAQLLQWLRIDSDTSLYGEGQLLDLRPGELLVRVEAARSERPGNWFNGPFKTLDHAQRYCAYLAGLGADGVRQVSALPRIWPDGTEGNPVEVIQTYEVLNSTPAIHSFTAPQRESGTRMITTEERRRLLAGDKRPYEPEFKGGGQQLYLPVVAAAKHGTTLVRLVPGATHWIQ